MSMCSNSVVDNVLTSHPRLRLQNTLGMLSASRRRTFPTMTVFWSRTRRRSYSLNFMGELTRRQSSTYLDMLLEKYAVFFIVWLDLFKHTFLLQLGLPTRKPVEGSFFHLQSQGGRPGTGEWGGGGTDKEDQRELWPPSRATGAAASSRWGRIWWEDCQILFETVQLSRFWLKISEIVCKG